MHRPHSRALGVALVAASLALAIPANAIAAEENPCLDKDRRSDLRLKCPDLRMRAPYNIYESSTASGKKILRAANSIDSIGRGPAELRGERSGNRTMDAKQRIHQKGGGKKSFKTGAELAFKQIPGQGRYWKFRDAAHFELWRLDDDGERKKRVEVGPKQIYCLRDLQHTNPGLKGSPGSAQYPGCNQDPGKQRVTLGTSVGWSDVYPSSYHEQYIDVSDLPRSGCYAYVHIADPRHGLFEQNEKNNEASTVVRLTEKGNYRGVCDVPDRGVKSSQRGDGSAPNQDAPPAGDPNDGSGDPGDGDGDGSDEGY